MPTNLPMRIPANSLRPAAAGKTIASGEIATAFIWLAVYATMVFEYLLGP